MPPKVGKGKAGKAGGKGKKGGKVKDPNDPEVIFATAATKINYEKQNLAVELAFNKDRLINEQVYNHHLEVEVLSLKDRLSKTTTDSDDILTHKQREIKLKMERLVRLEETLANTQRELAERNAELEKLRLWEEANREKLEDAIQLLVDKNVLEDVVRQQDQVIAKQEEDIERQIEMLHERDDQLYQQEVALEDLELKAQAVTNLRIAFGDPWLTKRTRARLRGAVPLDRDENSLSFLQGRLLVLYGGTGVNNEESLAVADLNTSLWTTGFGEVINGTVQDLRIRSGHTASAMSKSKLLYVGGRTAGKDKFPNELNILNADTQKWTIMNAKGTGPARSHHAACAVREKLFVFGGRTADGQLRNDLLVLDAENMKWEGVPLASVAAPSPRQCHSLAATEDGTRLWLFGGHNGHAVLNDLWCYDVEKRIWTSPLTTGLTPAPRELHATVVTNKYLLVASGVDGARAYTDIHVLNTDSREWEQLEPVDTEMAKGSHKMRARYATFLGTKLVTLRADEDERLNEVEVVEIGLPDNIDELYRQRAARNVQEGVLEICDDALTFPNAIEVSWKIPSRLVDRVEYYKLMMANSTGVVKEVCQGKFERFRVTGLLANTTYVFCVKAIYDNGTHAWSASKAFATRFGYDLPPRELGTKDPEYRIPVPFKLPQIHKKPRDVSTA